MRVHETAFIVSTYRSMHEDISQDPYAKLWNNKATDALIPNILKNISEDEAIMHSLRNRFFYERMRSFFSIHNGGTLINFGSGFSMYQFSLPSNVLTIEIDKPEIIEHKKQKVDFWIRKNKLPNRKVIYTAIDFNTKSKNEIITELLPYSKKTPVFILIEGVLFFLDRKTTNKLFAVFRHIQNKGDLIGSVSYTPEIETTEVYHRLLKYFDSNNDTNDIFNHQTLPNSYYKNIVGYDVKEHIDDFELSKIYAQNETIPKKEQLLNEHMYILESS